MIILFLQLALIFFIGKTYFELADYHKKNEWLYAFLGIITYYLGGNIFGLIVYLFLDAMGSSLIHTNGPLPATMTIIAGLIICWSLYKYLHTKWKSNKAPENSDILDDDII